MRLRLLPFLPALLAAAPSSAVVGISEHPIQLAGIYLNIPVRTGATKLPLRLIVDGVVVREFPVEYAPENPDFWVFVDVAPWRGRPAILQSEIPAGAPLDLSPITSSDQITSRVPIYTETLRPQFHYTSKRGRLNDPNGLLFYAGEYHLFYQLHPYGWGSANKHWGHAVSRDLVHWEELPIALYPDALGEMFSGSGVVDWNNTSGLQSGAEPPLILVFTGAKHPRTQGLAFSNDRGRTWTKYAGNPVLPNISRGNRDPKVFWHAATRHWIMTLSVGYPQPPGQPPRQTIEIFTSEDLKRWTFQSRNEGFHECPDLFELPLDGDASRRKWILHGGSSKYQVGSFDGRRFVPETPLLAGHVGNAFYAGQTFSDVPHGRRLQMGFAMVGGEVAKQIFAGMPFNQMLTFPCDLALRSTPDGPRLTWTPVPEIATLRFHQHRIGPRPLRDRLATAIPVTSGLLDVTLEFDPGTATEVTLALPGAILTYHRQTQELRCGPTRVPLPLANGRVRFRVLHDRGVLEIFARDGLIYAPIAVPPPAEPELAVRLSSHQGDANLVTCDVAELKTSWPPTVTALP
jgi:sucrose-6-phosphate hydrolase SacC (GH32 family)